MTARQILGILLILSPFLFMAAWVLYDEGWRGLIALGAAAGVVTAVVIVVGAGLYLLLPTVLK